VLAFIVLYEIRQRMIREAQPLLQCTACHGNSSFIHGLMRHALKYRTMSTYRIREHAGHNLLQHAGLGELIHDIKQHTVTPLGHA
jgi:hypothetical protein